jgi:ATP synthase subunit 6
VGLLPYQSTATSYIAVTFTLSLGMFISINIIGAAVNGPKIFGHAMPNGVPVVIAPFLTLIELVSYIARGFSLGIRLFANMLAGHALLKILASFS